MPQTIAAVNSNALPVPTPEFYQRLEAAPFVRIIFDSGSGSLKISRRPLLALCQQEGFESITQFIATALASGQWQLWDDGDLPAFLDRATPSLPDVPSSMFAFMHVHSQIDPALSFIIDGSYVQ